MRTSKALLAFVSVASGALLLRCGARSELAVDGLDASIVPCVEGTVAMHRANPTVMFVLDRSTSMSGELATSSSQQSRWQLLSDALAATLPAIDSVVGTGLLLFPSSTQGPSCSVNTTADLDPAIGNVPSLITLVQDASPGGATPTAAAIDAAAQVLVALRAATTARAMVLATDGGPDCNTSLDPTTCQCVSGSCDSSTRCLDDVRTIERIAHYRAEGIPSYVIGIQDEGDTDLSDVLDRMAEAGGRPQSGGSQLYYAAHSEAELNAALVTIRDQVGSCTYLMDSIPGEGASVTVYLDDSELPADGTTEGWAWGAESNGEIVLVGDTCTAAAEGDPTLVAYVECPDEE